MLFLRLVSRFSSGSFGFFFINLLKGLVYDVTLY